MDHSQCKLTYQVIRLHCGDHSQSLLDINGTNQPNQLHHTHEGSALFRVQVFDKSTKRKYITVNFYNIIMFLY